MTRKLSAPQFRLLSAMATDGSDGRQGYLSARPGVTAGTAASCVSAGWMEWDTLDEEVAHQITDAGREAVAAYVSGGNREMVAQPVQQQQARASRETPSAPAPAFEMVKETAEDRDAANIANATSFTATIRNGGTMTTIRDLPTMAEAGASAILMERNLENGFQALVYAVTAEGRTAMVRRVVWEEAVAEALAALPPEPVVEDDDRHDVTRNGATN